MIDFHTHAPNRRTATWLSGAAFGATEFLAFMDSAGIDHAVVLSHDGLFHSSPETNEDLAEFVAADPDRLVGFGTYHPHHPDALREIRRNFADLGLRGLKLHPWLQGFSAHEPKLDPLLDVVAEHNGILLVHDGTPPYSMPGQITALARRHPDVPVVLGHAGLHDLWREALACALDTENLYLCLCGTPPYAAKQILDRAPAGKVVFGTDAGLSDRASQDYAIARIREIGWWGIDARQQHELTQTAPRALLAHAGIQVEESA